jgi:hypothetical protein
MSEIQWLMKWYATQCNGEWEHQFGVKIETLDNPGWSITIDLEETALESREYARVDHDMGDKVSWWTCRIEENQWRAACAPGDLATVVGLFRDWAESDQGIAR